MFESKNNVEDIELKISGESMWTNKKNSQDNEVSEHNPMLSSTSRSHTSDLESSKAVDEELVMRKISRNLLSNFFLLTLLCYIDRTNLAFAAVQLNKDLGFSDQVYGLGAGLFFAGYTLFQLPSNWALMRWGAPTWLCCIAVAWGTLAALFAAVSGEASFYVLRILLGVAEAGTFPGMWYHMSCFYTEQELAFSYSVLLTGITLAQVVGAPLAAGLLMLDGWLGLRGWQWLFIAEGVPTILVGLRLRASLAESPAKASCLDVAERAWLATRQAGGKAAKAAAGAEVAAAGAARNWRVWYLAGLGLLQGMAKYAILFWCPLIILSMLNDSGLGALEGDVAGGQRQGALVALLTAIPFSAAAAAMVLNAKLVARTRRRKPHVAAPLLISGVSLALIPLVVRWNAAAAFMLLVPTTVVWAAEGVFMSWPAVFLQGPAAATGVAIINSVGNCGGIVGPYVTGVLHSATGGYSAAMVALAAVLATAAAMAACFPEPRELAVATFDDSAPLESQSPTCKGSPAKAGRRGEDPLELARLTRGAGSCGAAADDRERDGSRPEMKIRNGSNLKRPSSTPDMNV